MTVAQPPPGAAGRLAALALAACAAACVQSAGSLGAAPRGAPVEGPATRSPSEPIVEPTAARSSARRAPALPATVSVRLTALDERNVVEVLEPGGASRTFRREGREVVDLAGRRGARLTVEAPPGGRLRVEGRSYAGRIAVRPHPRHGLRVTNEVDLETYVAGVVAAELPLWSAAPAELEAQAVAARTYAACELAHRAAEGSDVELLDGVLDQAYRGLFEAGSAAAEAVGRRLDEAVRATRGLVLLRGERFEEARFHAACGGRTASFLDVFPKASRDRAGDPRHGPGESDCPPCRERAAREAAAERPDAQRPLGWSHTISAALLAKAGEELGLGGTIEAFGPKRLDASGRWLDVQLRGPSGVAVVPCDEFRRVIGYGSIKSARIVRTVPPLGRPIAAGLQVEGVGRGHGVGLCQEGARDLALAGWSAEAILAHYYRGARLARLTPGVAAAEHDAEIARNEAAGAERAEGRR